MLQLQAPFQQRSRLLLLLAQVRTRVWTLLFADSHICYDQGKYVEE